MTIPVEVARLYDELRDCIRANDQQGVRRIFAELVRARRPVSEISGVVDGLSKAGEKEEPEANGSSLDDAPQRSAVPEFDSTTPEPTDQDPDRSTDPGVGPPRDEASAVATTSEPEGDRALMDQWLEPGTIPEVEQSVAEAALQIGDWATAPYSQPENVQDVAIATDEAEPSGSGDIAWSSNAAPPPGRRTGLLSSRAGIRAAVIVVLVIVGTGVFLLIRPTVKEVGAGTVLSVESASTGSADLPVTGSAPARQPSTIAAPGTTSTDRPAEVATTALIPAPAASPPAIAPAVPDGRSTDRPSAKPAVTGSEAPNKTVATGLTAPEGTAPPPATAPAAPGSPSAHRPDAKPALANVEAPTKAAAVVPAAPDRPAPAALPPTIAPAAPDGPSADRPDPKPAVASLEAPKNAAPTVSSATPASPGPSASTPVAATPESAPPKDPPSTSVETAPLLERGDRLFGVGDIASARLFYERAADAGDGQAALRLGETYDPAFLERAQLRVQGDRALAVFWYRRARELGASEAEILLKGAQTR